MGKKPASQHVDPAQRGDTALEATRWFAFVSAAALLIDIVTITIINGPFDPLDSTLYFFGLVTMALTLVSFAIYLSRKHTGYGRVGFAVVAFLGSVVVLGAISLAFDFAGRAIFSPANVGLYGEWSFFSVALCLLGIGLWASFHLHRHEPVAPGPTRAMN